MSNMQKGKGAEAEIRFIEIGNEKDKIAKRASKKIVMAREGKELYGVMTEMELLPGGKESIAKNRALKGASAKEKARTNNEIEEDASEGR